jgi:TusA-related sulfurtransferase
VYEYPIETRLSHLLTPGRKEKDVDYPLDVTALEDLQPDHLVDARGSACPGPLLEAKKGIGDVPVGGILEVRSSDQGSRRDIPLWAKKMGHELLGIAEGPEGYDRIFVRRGK